MENNKSKPTAVIVVAILVLLLGVGAAAYALLQDGANDEEGRKASTATTGTEQAPAASTTDEAGADLPVIVFTDDGFTQPTYTFPAGTAIRVENRSSMDMQFSSDDHPTHRDNPELNLPLLGAGESGTFTPPGKGTYKFHDHINDQFEGTLVIE